MAIAEMSRVRIYGMETEREPMLAVLMHSGIIQIEDAAGDAAGTTEDAKASDAVSASPGTDDGTADTSLRLRRLDDPSAVHAVESLVQETVAALTALDRHAPVKKGLFSARRALHPSQWAHALAQQAPTMAVVREIRGLEERLTECRAEEARLQGRIEYLRPWLGVGFDLSEEATRTCVIQAGLLPARQSVETVQADMQAAGPASLLVRHAVVGDAQHCVAIWHRAVTAEVQGVLKEANWNRVPVKETGGTPDAIVAELEKRLAGLTEEKKALVAQVADKAGAREEIETLHDALLMERDRMAVRARIAATGKAFSVLGWVPSDRCGALRKQLEQEFVCAVEVEAPAVDEEVPVLVRSNGFTEAIRPVMDMYGSPSSREIDPNFLTLPFFAIFFGLIMADAGYGLILAGAAGLVLWKFRLEMATRRFAKLILFCGISTIVWGILFGSFFGIEALSQYAVWFPPGEEGGTERLMVWCLLFGVIHLFTGMGLKAANLLRRGQVLDAICDVGFPYVMFSGFGMTILPNVPGLDPTATAPVAAVGLYVFGVGTALVLATSGRKSKTILGKVFGGLPRLYDIIGFLGDVLSYMRLLALSLAGGILSGLINGMASDLGNLIARILGGTLLLLLGHGINFAMGILGAFVHSCRLQYLEFFTKFLEGGGTPFRAFGPTTKYTVMKQED